MWGVQLARGIDGAPTLPLPLPLSEGKATAVVDWKQATHARACLALELSFLNCRLV